MSSAEEFDDSIDEILANITSSQLDPSLSLQRSDKPKQISAETQTDLSFAHILNDIPKRKLVIIETDKHHHKPCVYHNNSSSQTTEPQNKRFKPEIENDSNESNFSDINNENEFINESITESKSSSQTVLITNEELENWSQTQSSASKECLLTQNSLQQLLSEWTDEEDSEVVANDDSDDEIDGHRSPLLELDGNGFTERSALRPSQESLLLKTQISQNSNSSQNSSVLSF